MKTLAIRSTAEEAMIKRREILKGRSGKLPGVIEEAGMRHFIEVFFCHAEALSTLINYEYTEPCISF